MSRAGDINDIQGWRYTIDEETGKSILIVYNFRHYGIEWDRPVPSGKGFEDVAHVALNIRLPRISFKQLANDLLQARAHSWRSRLEFEQNRRVKMAAAKMKATEHPSLKCECGRWLDVLFLGPPAGVAREVFTCNNPHCQFYKRHFKMPIRELEEVERPSEEPSKEPGR